MFGREDGRIHSARSCRTLLAAMQLGGLPTDSSGVALKEARTVANHHNALVHGDPISAQENIVMVEGGELAYSVSKDLDSPEKVTDDGARRALIEHAADDVLDRTPEHMRPPYHVVGTAASTSVWGLVSGRNQKES
jgi:hypothetical protein